MIREKVRFHGSQGKMGYQWRSVIKGHRGKRRRRGDWKPLLSLSYLVVSNSFVTPMDCSPPGSSVHGILQARTLEWAAISLVTILEVGGESGGASFSTR